MKKSFVSIAMATYNGASFIEPQLESIINQTVLPSELVICDDRSTDDTVKILEHYRQRAPFPVNVHINEKNLGVTGNFSKAADLCTGDYIAFADQDDYWLPDKLEQEMQYLEDRPEMDIVFTDLQLVDENLKPLGKTMWEHLGFGTKAQQDWSTDGAFPLMHNTGNKVTGCTMMIRSSAWPGYKPYIEKGVEDKLHDEIMALLAAREGKIGFIPKCTVLYRQHERQSVGTRNDYKHFNSGRNNPILSFFSRKPMEVQLKELSYKYKVLKALSFYGADVEEAYQKVTFFEERLNAAGFREKIQTIFKNYRQGNYQKFTNAPLKNIIKDLIT